MWKKLPDHIENVNCNIVSAYLAAAIVIAVNGWAIPHFLNTAFLCLFLIVNIVSSIIRETERRFKREEDDEERKDYSSVRNLEFMLERYFSSIRGYCSTIEDYCQDIHEAIEKINHVKKLPTPENPIFLRMEELPEDWKKK